MLLSLLLSLAQLPGPAGYTLPILDLDCDAMQSVTVSHQAQSDLEVSGDFDGTIKCSSMISLNNGDYLALFHDDGHFVDSQPNSSHNKSYSVYQMRSNDGGRTWGTPQVIASHPRAKFCEPFILRSPDGKQLACLMGESSGQYNSFFMTSNDEGTTWSTPQQLPAALTGNHYSATYSANGRLLLSFSDTARRSPTQGDWVGWVGTYRDLVDGHEGQYRIRFNKSKHDPNCVNPSTSSPPSSSPLSLAELDLLLASEKNFIHNPPNPATTPIPREGWWMERHRAIQTNLTLAGYSGIEPNLIFIGDSITQGWENAGKEIWEAYYSPRQWALNFGISGDRTQHVLWRLQHSSALRLDTKVAVVLIGTNNSNSDSAADIADGIFAILRLLRTRQPEMNILLLNIFPRGADAEDPLRKINDDVNRRIALAADDSMIEVLDLSSAFLDENGKLQQSKMPDYLHPNAEGYTAWAKGIEPTLQAWLP